MTQPYEPLDFGEKPAPPVYKRPWFVVFAGLVVAGVLGLLIGGMSAQETSGGTSSASAVSAAPPPPATSSSTAPTVPSSTAPTVPSSTAPTVPSPTEAPTPSGTTAGVDFTMPDVVGMDLQSAQDLIQTHGVFFTASHDLLGSRNQVLDSNWTVCDQNVPAGQQVSGDVEGDIDFGVVKREESCP